MSWGMALKVGSTSRRISSMSILAEIKYRVPMARLCVFGTSQCA